MARLAASNSASSPRCKEQQSAPLRRSPRKKNVSSQNGGHAEPSRLGKAPELGHMSVGVNQVSRPATKPPAVATPRRNVLREIDLPDTSDVEEVETFITSAQRSRTVRSSNEIDTIVSGLDKVSLTTKLTEARHEERKVGAISNRSANVQSQKHYTSRFVLQEANCVDDYSDVPEDEDEETDLSGFIVDDEAELSYHESAGESSEDDYRPSKPPSRPRRRLQRGHRRIEDSDSDKENDSEIDLANAMDDLSLRKSGPVQHRKTVPEVIDLTSSPIFTSHVETSNAVVEDPVLQDTCHGVDSEVTQTSKLPSLFESLLRLSPPKQSELGVSSKGSTAPNVALRDVEVDSIDVPERPSTPKQPLTPPRLKSPSKLLSPSKRATNLRSPHRQSADAFWDHHTVNDWNDTYSPKKAPAASPRKNPLAKFAIWSDVSDNDSDMDDQDSSSSLPSPCASPTKPPKSPEKAARAAYLAEKRAEKARRQAFDNIKEQLANDLLAYLDGTVTLSKISTLSASTGGIQIIWSKTLRSTAGRANYKRTVEVPAAPNNSNAVPDSPTKRKAHHHATIELAEKVIDREARLVNTLAHEFCHLADFMISGVRNQPHGPSFMSWAQKAVAAMKTSSGAEGYQNFWKECEISTKHNYEIEWKYLWVCEGRKELERTPVQKFLNVEVQEGGCGAEYGRHSKSINTERMRCGRCKGKLVQVRPLPRASPVKGRVGGGLKVKKGSGSGGGSDNSRSSSDGSVGGKLGDMIEVVELSD